MTVTNSHAELPEREFKERVCEAVSLQPVALDRYYVETPFLLPGGDAVPVILEDRAGGWRLTDDGETFMQLALLQPNFDQGNRWKVIQAALKSHRVDVEAGVLSLTIPNTLYAEALSSFIQAIVEVMDVRHWTRDVVRETFREDAGALVANVAPHAQFDYQDPDRDPSGLYKLDAAEARGGINFRLAEWWRSDSPEPGKWETLPTVGGYLGLRSCVIEFLLSNEGGGWQITYLAAREPLALGDEEDDSGNQ